MANIRISDLPQAFALDGTEEVPIVQSGTTKRAASGLFGGGSGTIASSNIPSPAIVVSPSADSTGAELVLYQDTLSPAAGDKDSIKFNFNNVAAVEDTFASIQGKIADITALNEESNITFNSYALGVFKERMRVDNGGRVNVGWGGSGDNTGGTGPQFQVAATTNSAMGVFRFNSGQFGPTISLYKSKTNTVGAQVTVTTSDILGQFVWQGTDGATWQAAGILRCAVDATPGIGDMPGRISLWTAPDGTATPVERFVVKNDGGVIVGPNNTSPGLGNLKVTGWIGTLVSTVGGLPSAVTAGPGARAFVTDANSTAWGAAAAAGGANSVPVYSDGAAWYIG